MNVQQSAIAIDIFTFFPADFKQKTILLFSNSLHIAIKVHQAP